MVGDNTIQSLWVGECLTKVERLSIQSFLANGHDYHLYVYSHVDGIPAGVTVKDASSVIPAGSIFRIKGSLSIFADWFRQELLFAHGGYWADLDIVCLKPLRFDDEIVVGKEDSSKVSNAVMRFPKGHEITRALADVSREPNRPMPYDTAADRRRARRGGDRRWRQSPRARNETTGIRRDADGRACRRTHRRDGRP